MPNQFLILKKLLMDLKPITLVETSYLNTNICASLKHHKKKKAELSQLIP